MPSKSLTQIDLRQGRIVELRFFGGFSTKGTARVLGSRLPRSAATGTWRELGCIAN
jgi:hypothetical protein